MAETMKRCGSSCNQNRRCASFATFEIFDLPLHQLSMPDGNDRTADREKTFASVTIELNC